MFAEQSEHRFCPPYLADPQRGTVALAKPIPILHTDNDKQAAVRRGRNMPDSYCRIALRLRPY
jgi:hypothetical protein